MMNHFNKRMHKRMCQMKKEKRKKKKKEKKKERGKKERLNYVRCRKLSMSEVNLSVTNDNPYQQPCNVKSTKYSKDNFMSNAQKQW